MATDYRCTITSVWVKTTEKFKLTIRYLGQTFEFDLFGSEVDASNFATEWFIENVNETDEACSETS